MSEPEKPKGPESRRGSGSGSTTSRVPLENEPNKSSGSDTPGPPKMPPDNKTTIPRHRFLTDAEWAALATGLGALRDQEHHAPVHPTNWLWPPKGMVRGLYRDVVQRRTVYWYLYHVASVSRWGLMIVQLFIGAALTALGPRSFSDGTSITLLGATNTVIAGLLALLHNSGLPDRYRHNMFEFEQLEDRIREILDTGLAPADCAVDQTLAECFSLFQQAKATVVANMPANYNSKKDLGSRLGQKLVSAAAAPVTDDGEEHKPSEKPLWPKREETDEATSVPK